MSYQSPYSNQVNPYQSEGSNGKAVTGLTFGIISMIAWLIPVVGLITAIIGLVASNQALHGFSQLGMARAGKVLSTIALVLACINMLLGIMLAMH